MDHTKAEDMNAWLAMVDDFVKPGSELFVRFVELRKHLTSGIDISAEFARLVAETKQQMQTAMSSLASKEGHLKTVYAVGKRVSYRSGEHTVTGRVTGFINPGEGRSRHISRLKICRDDGLHEDLALIYGEGCSDLKIIDDDHTPMLDPSVQAWRSAQQAFQPEDWVEFSTGWRTIQARVVGLRKDGRLMLHYDGSRRTHPPIGMKKIPKPQ